MDRSLRDLRVAAIAFGLLLPVFFQLQGSIYRNPGPPLIDSGGSVQVVPLPLSIIVCLLAIGFVARFSEAVLSLRVTLALLATMLGSAYLAGDVDTRKALLVVQFGLPLMGLVLGQMLGRGDEVLRATATGFMAVILLVVPAQLVRSIGYEAAELPHDVWLFSIYQNRQYVPVVFVSAYLIWLFSYWRPTRFQFVLAGAMGYYAAASFSTLALLELLTGMVVLFLATRRDRTAGLSLLTAVVLAGAFFIYNVNSPALRHKYAFGEAAGRYATPAGVIDMQRYLFPEGTLAASLPVGVQERLRGWGVYLRGTADSEKTLLFGHASPPPRSEATSAHNYYLDFLYNFGFVGLLPLLWLVIYTFDLFGKARRHMDLPLIGLTVILFFILVFESGLKVPLRQPYPGIFSFFLWGLFIQLVSQRLSSVHATHGALEVD
jgi:hypothetical protein